MKVGHILYSGLGGHGSVFFSLARAPSSTNIRHFPIFFGVEPLRSEYKKLCEELELGFEVILKKPGDHFGSQFRLLKILNRTKPDAIIAHSSPCVLAGAAYRCRHPTVPLLFVEHQPNHQKTKQEWIASALAPWLCQKVVYLSDRSQEEIHDRLGPLFRPARAEVIPNGIDTDLFCPSEITGAKKDFRVGMAARMTSLKDQETLIRAIGLAAPEVENLKLYLAGDGPEKKKLEELTRTLNLGERIEFLGMLDESDLVAFYQNLDIYAHSTHGETMSTSIMQAQSCGLPVIASDVSGVNNHLTPHVDGILSPPNDPQALADLLLKLTNSPDTLEYLSRASREKAVRLYSHSTMRQSYERTLEKVRTA